jgi:hypothetical protein
MTAANWARTYARLQRYILELREQGCQVLEPANFETAPALRPTGRTYLVGEHGPETALPPGRHPLL